MMEKLNPKIYQKSFIGGENDFNTTLQAVSCADVINKKFNMRVDKKTTKIGPGKAKLTSKRVYRPSNHKTGVYIILSGGTNGLSKQLAEQCEVRCNGVAIGTYARDIIEYFVSHLDFYENFDIIKEAYLIAHELVKLNIK